MRSSWHGCIEVPAFTLIFSVFGLASHLYPVICSRGPYLPLQKLLTSILCYLLLLPKGVRHVHFCVVHLHGAVTVCKEIL